MHLLVVELPSKRSAHAITLQEAAVVAELPLPPDLERLHTLFLALNGVHSFLLSQHIQVCAVACPTSALHR